MSKSLVMKHGCGCVSAMIVADPVWATTPQLKADHHKDVAKFYSEAVRRECEVVEVDQLPPLKCDGTACRWPKRKPKRSAV